PKPLMAENQELLAIIADLQQQVDRLRAQLTLRKSPPASRALHVLLFVLSPILLLVLAHVALIVKLDVNPIVMRAVSILIPLPFGFALGWFVPLGWRTAACLGVIIGVGSVSAMAAIIGYTDAIPIMPQNYQEWRETIEYGVSIALATVTGNILASLLRNTLTRPISPRRIPSAVAMRIARMVGPNIGERALRQRAERFEARMRSARTLGGVTSFAVGSVSPGVRALIGG